MLIPCPQTSAINLGGRQYRAAKVIDGRTRGAAETRQLVEPHLRRAGITRLASVHGLDRLGVPVVLAIRPASQTLSTNAGKGLEIAGAWISAAMEGIEVFHAETVAAELRRVSWREIASKFPVIEPERLALKAGCQLLENWPLDWKLGWDLLQQREIAVPLGMITMAYATACYDFRIFVSDSNGLASGNHVLEAALAGLLEVVERDAITSHAVLNGPNMAPAIASSTAGRLGELLRLLDDKGLDVHLRDYTGELGIPVIKAYLVDRLQPELGIYHGHAAALSTADACLKAVLEAVQARAVYIAGSRDDMYQEVLSARRDRRNVKALARWLAAVPKQETVYRDLTTQTLEGDIGVVLENLRRNKIRQVAVVELTQPDWPIHVVKVIVPGLEGYMSSQYAPGSLLMERRAQRASAGKEVAQCAA